MLLTVMLWKVVFEIATRGAEFGEWEVLGKIEESNRLQWKVLGSAVTEIGGDLRVGMFALIVAGISTALFETGVLARSSGKWIHAAAILPVGVLFGVVAAVLGGDESFQGKVVSYGASGFVLSIFALLRPTLSGRAAVVGSIACAVIVSSMAGDAASYFDRAYYGLIASPLSFVGRVTAAFSRLGPLAWFMVHLWPTTNVQPNSESPTISGA